MWFSWFMLVVGLAAILVGCDVFTNSIEWLGQRLDISEGVLGSIFAAVGTALPETLIPIVAVVFGATAGESHANDVGLGAIIGAPFMLATVAMFVTGVAIYIFSRRNGRSLELRVSSKILSRDIRFFIIAFGVAIAAGFIQSEAAKIVIAICLLVFYGYYVFKHATDSSEARSTPEDAEELSPLHFMRQHPNPPLSVIILQAIVGVGIIIGSATLFVQYVSDVANSVGLTPLILSLIVVPLATELPEKFNSVLWVRRSKDTLALGNITGAMVFQSTIPVSFGMVFTEWHAGPQYAAAFAQAGLAILAAAVLFAGMVIGKRLTARALVLSGVWYIAWLILVFPVGLENLVRKLVQNGG